MRLKAGGVGGVRWRGEEVLEEIFESHKEIGRDKEK